MTLRYLELSFFIFFSIYNNAIQFQDIILLTTLFTFSKNSQQHPQKQLTTFQNMTLIIHTPIKNKATCKIFNIQSQIPTPFLEVEREKDRLTQVHPKPVQEALLFLFFRLHRENKILRH